MQKDFQQQCLQDFVSKQSNILSFFESNENSRLTDHSNIETNRSIKNNESNLNESESLEINLSNISFIVDQKIYQQKLIAIRANEKINSILSDQNILVLFDIFHSDDYSMDRRIKRVAREKRIISEFSSVAKFFFSLDFSIYYRKSKNIQDQHTKIYATKKQAEKQALKKQKKQSQAFIKKMIKNKNIPFKKNDKKPLFIDRKNYSMENILSCNWNNLLHVRFSSCKLDDECLRILMNNQERLPFLQKIILTNNKITNRGLEIFLQKLPNFKFLTDYDFGYNLINDEGMKLICQDKTNHLQSYKVSFKGNGIGDEGMRYFCQCPENHPNLIYFNNCNDPNEAVYTKGKVSDLGMEYFSRTFNVLRKLQSIKLTGNAITNKGLKYFSDQMNLIEKLTVLDLDHNFITEEGFEYFIQKCYGDQTMKKSILITINFAHNKIRKFSQKVLRWLCGSQKLRFLFLVNNPLQDDAQSSDIIIQAPFRFSVAFDLRVELKYFSLKNLEIFYNEMVQESHKFDFSYFTNFFKDKEPNFINQLIRKKKNVNEIIFNQYNQNSIVTLQQQSLDYFDQIDQQQIDITNIQQQQNSRIIFDPNQSSLEKIKDQKKSEQIFANLSILDLSFCEIESEKFRALLPILKKFVRLEHLNLDNNSINQIQKQSFKQLQSIFTYIRKKFRLSLWGNPLDQSSLVRITEFNKKYKYLKYSLIDVREAESKDDQDMILDQKIEQINQLKSAIFQSLKIALKKELLIQKKFTLKKQTQNINNLKETFQKIKENCGLEVQKYSKTKQLIVAYFEDYKEKDKRNYNGRKAELDGLFQFLTEEIQLVIKRWIINIENKQPLEDISEDYVNWLFGKIKEKKINNQLSKAKIQTL